MNTRVYIEPPCWWVSPAGEEHKVPLHGHASWAAAYLGDDRSNWDAAQELMREGWIQISGHAVRSMVSPLRGEALSTCQMLLVDVSEVHVCMVVAGQPYGECAFEQWKFSKRRVIRLEDLQR